MKKRWNFYLIGIFLLAISFFLDKSVTSFFVNNKIGWLDSIFLFIHGLEIYMLFAFVLVILLLFRQKNKILPLILTFALVMGVTQLLKVIIARPRPFTKFPFSDLGETGVNRSFPSGHSSGTASIIRFFEFNKILSYSWIFITILVMFSRIYLGMHYLSDVIAGFLVGYFVSDLSFFLVGKLKKTGK